MKLLVLSREEDRDLALRNGGTVVGEYLDGWLVRVLAEQVGEVTYRLRDGTLIRRYSLPAQP